MHTHLDMDMANKLMLAAQKIGLDQNMMDEETMWAMKKIMIGSCKMVKIMKDKNMSDGEIAEEMRKISKLVLDKDTIMKMAEEARTYKDDTKW